MSEPVIKKAYELDFTKRYKRSNMAKAMRGKIERALVELITNSDDSYRDLEEQNIQISGKIRIEVERRRGNKPSLVIVRDKAAGMSAKQMEENICHVGNRTSGFEAGKKRRGLHGRGAKDVVIFGSAHFESIKDEKYSHLILSPSLKYHWIAIGEKVTDYQRKELGISRGNGTVVTVEVSSSFSIPTHEKLGDLLSRYYSLRDIMSNNKRGLVLVDLNSGREQILRYSYPQGSVVLDKPFDIPGYKEANARLLVRKHETPYEQDTLPLREGIIIKSGVAIHDCTYFGLESDQYSWRFTGELYCEYIDKLIRDYDDLETSSDSPNHPTSNPTNILDPNRDGLVDDHPFARNLKQECRKYLKTIIDDLRVKEAPPKKSVVSEELNNKLKDLSKEISRIFEKKLIELEEEIIPGSSPQGDINDLPNGMYLIPPEEEPIIVNQPKVFTVKIVNRNTVDESMPISINSSNDKVIVKNTPVFLRRFSEDKTIGTSTFVLESDEVGIESIIDVKYDGFNQVVIVNTIEPSASTSLPLGLTFDKPAYTLKVNKEKSLFLWLNTPDSDQEECSIKVDSNSADIVIKGGQSTILRATEIPGIYKGKIRLLGRKIKAKGIITASLLGSNQNKTTCKITVEEKEDKSHINFKFEPDEEHYGSLRYKWDESEPYLLKIAAKHPSIRQYLGHPIGDSYPGKNSRLYYSVLAEVIAEALAFKVLERVFRVEGEQGMLDFTSVDANFHKCYSEFLTISHGYLNSEVDIGTFQTRLL